MTGQKILILGGTREAAKLAEQLVEQGHHVTTSLAGRTKEPTPPAGNTRIGGFGGANGLAEYLRSEAIDKLIDATHPFAKQISANAKAAAALTSIHLQTIERAPWEKLPDDIWIEVGSLEEARNAIPGGARILLALGKQHIDLFKSRTYVHYVVRMVDAPEDALSLPDYELVIGKPSSDANEEARLLKSFAITHIVCRNSGGKGAYAKIEAARMLQIPVIIVGR